MFEPALLEIVLVGGAGLERDRLTLAVEQISSTGDRLVILLGDQGNQVLERRLLRAVRWSIGIFVTSFGVKLRDSFITGRSGRFVRQKSFELGVRYVLLDKVCTGLQALASSALNVCDAKGAEPILSMERVTMRPFILISAALVVASPAVAHNWQEYSYPDYSFSVTFPADPQIETTTYRVTDDRKVEAHVYSVRGDNAEFKVTVAELADPGPEQTAVIDHAIKTLSEGGEVKADVPHHIRGVFGRQLSIVCGDGSRVAVALFAYHGRLYQIEGKSLPAGNDATGDALRFVQSLIFTGGGPNRSADETLADRSACSGPHGPGHAGVPGAAAPDDGRRFEIECRRQHAQVALWQAVNSGDLTGAQRAYSSLSQFPSSADPNGPLAQAISQVGQALKRGDLTAAQNALASLH